MVNVALLVVVGRKLGLSPLASLAVAAWPPAFYLLSIGQWELVVLTLAMIGWQSARGGRDWRAGALFGLAALAKLYPALLVLPLQPGQARLINGAYSAGSLLATATRVSGSRATGRGRSATPLSSATPRLLANPTSRIACTRK